VKIVNVVPVDDCFDGNIVFRYWFNNAWTKDSLATLAVFGKLEYFPDFAKPFFRVVNCNGFQIKGVEGDCSCLVILPMGQKDSFKFEFENNFVN
jgi:hypothetical protein